MTLLSKQSFRSYGSSSLQRGWLDFRNGHSVYLSFILTFMNSILIAYNFAVSQFAFLNNIFYSIGLFALFFLGVYIPTSVIIGYWHRRHQWIVENEALLQENWVWAWIARYQIRLIEGKATYEETKQVLDYLEAILQRQKNGACLTGGKNIAMNHGAHTWKRSSADSGNTKEEKIYSLTLAQSQIKKE